MYYMDEIISSEIAERTKKVAESGMFVLGPETEEFEVAMTEKLFKNDALDSLFVSNGTDAIELALWALKLTNSERKSPYVLMPALTVPMVRWAVERAGFIPVPIDVNPATQCMDIDFAVQEMDRIHDFYGQYPFAVLFVYTGGIIPADIEDLCFACRLKHVFFIEPVGNPSEWLMGNFLDSFIPGIGCSITRCPVIQNV